MAWRANLVISGGDQKTRESAMNQSAGCLLYRRSGEGLEVLLVHPSGNYNRRAPWSIPKGVPEPGEDLETAARRETREETGMEPADLVDLGSIDYSRSRKRVHCFAGPAPEDAELIPASGEVDRAEFVPFAEAAKLILPDQRPFLDRLAEHLGTV